MRVKFCRSDYTFYTLLVILALLTILGILILASSSASISQQNFGSPNYILFHQIKFGLLPGIFLGGVCFLISLPTLRKWAFPFMIAVLVLTGLVFLPKIGLSGGGASRWINLGLISFQPSEFLKIATILYLAAWFSNLAPSSSRSKFTDRIHAFSKSKFTRQTSIFSLEGAGLIPFLIIIGLVSLILILQPDISTLGIIVVTAVLMYFVAAGPIAHIIFLFLTGVTGLIALIRFAPYRLNRLLSFLESGIDPTGISYQINQALIGVGAGGVLGTGLGMGLQKFGFLPQPLTDSIFAIWAEETGFIGSFFLLLLFLFFAWQGFRIAKRAPDKFSQLSALGISCWISIQALVNIGSITGVLPLTGIPLPLISYGGSHLIAELMGVGILFNISKQNI